MSVPFPLNVPVVERLPPQLLKGSIGGTAAS